MTGLRPDSTKVWDLNTHFRDHVPDVVTVSQHFKDHGYRSISMGKIYHGGFDDALSWSEPALKPGTGSRYVLKKNISRMDEKKRVARKKGLKGKDLSRASRGPPTESADVEDQEYSDGALATLAVQTIKQLSHKDQPFFLAVGFQNPHLPFNSPKKYWDLYKPQAIGLASNPFAPKNAYSKALTTFGELRNYEGIPAKGPLDEETSKKLRHGYYAAVSFIDACIGRVLKELEESGLSENTIVVVWGDHGWKLGEHGCWCKHTNVQLDTRSPLIVVAPKGLLRHKLCTSTFDEMAEGTQFKRVFQERFPDEIVEPEKVRRVVFCSGQVYFELLEARRKGEIDDVALVTIEQLSPFPFDLVAETMKSYTNAEVVWAQEEPKNMGAWSFVQDRIMTASRVINGERRTPGYVGRKTMASPAEGYGSVHDREQKAIVDLALSDDVTTWGWGRTRPHLSRVLSDV